MSEEIPIILLPGMAADERLFEAQRAVFPTLRVPRWITPRNGESLRCYAARLAPAIDPGRACLVGGASFGGIVALELSAYLPALGCVLIGSLRTPAELPVRWRLLEPLAALGPEALRVMAGVGGGFGRRILNPASARRLKLLASPELAFTRWAMSAVLRWRPSPAARRVRVFRIHGSSDRVLPAPRGFRGTIVPGGSHALTLFNPGAVNRFLGAVVRDITGQVRA